MSLHILTNLIIHAPLDPLLVGPATSVGGGQTVLTQREPSWSTLEWQLGLCSLNKEEGPNTSVCQTNQSSLQLHQVYRPFVLVFMGLNMKHLIHLQHWLMCLIMIHPVLCATLQYEARRSWSQPKPTALLHGPGSTMATELNASNRDRRTYECVDVNAEGVPGGDANNNGAHFYFTESTCNGINCPPYANGNELACVVCTKWAILPWLKFEQ